MIERAPRWRAWGPLLFLSALVLLVVQPLLQAGFPATSDGTLHLLRSVELDSLLRQGYLFPRWAADLWLGLGYPLFNFYGPLLYYIAEVFRPLGLGAVGAFKVAIVLACAVGAGATFLLARRYVGVPAALVAATAYVLMPHALRELYRGGDYPQLLAMMLLPVVLWSLHVVAPARGLRAERPPDASDQSQPAASRRRGFISLLPPMAAGAALLLAHNVSALLFAPVVIVYAIFLVIVQGERGTLGRLAIVAGLALGLSAFFWLPALTEKSATQVENLLSGYFDFHNHFLQLGDLLAPSTAPDLATMNPPVVSTLGQVQLALAAASLLALWPRLGFSRATRALLALCAFFGLAAALLTLRISQPIWEALPLLALAQFPNRLLTIVGLATALLAGLGVEALSRRSSRLGVLYGLIALSALIYTALPRLYPTPPLEWQRDPTVADITRYEVRTGALGTSSGGEFLPREAELRPGSTALADAYLNGKPIERLDRGPLPPGTTGTTLVHEPNLERVEFDGPGGFGALFNLIYFPGWRAYVDGLAAVSKPLPPTAMTLVEVPAGRHVVELRFEDTPVRTLGQVVSLASVLVIALGVALQLRSRRSTRARAPSVAVATERSSKLQAGTVLPHGGDVLLAGRVPASTLYLGLFALVLVAKVGFVDPRTEWFRVNSSLPRVAGVAHPLQLDFANGMRFLGYDLTAQRVRPGASFDLMLYWQTTRALTRDYSVFVHLLPMTGEQQVAQADNMHPGPNPTTRWPVDKYARDLHQVYVPPDLAPGRYRLHIGLYDSGQAARVPLLEGQSKSEPLILAEVEVER